MTELKWDSRTPRSHQCLHSVRNGTDAKSAPSQDSAREEDNVLKQFHQNTELSHHPQINPSKKPFIIAKSVLTSQSCSVIIKRMDDDDDDNNNNKNANEIEVFLSNQLSSTHSFFPLQKI